MPQTPQAQPRARGAVFVSAKRRGAASVLDGLRQSGSLKVLFPRATGPALQAVLVNTAGGVTGGDRFRLNAVAGPGTELTLTTQACERAYRAQGAETGELHNHLAAGPGARINWLPQETLLFQGSALRRTLRVDLAGDARLLMAEPLVFGRAAMGERLTRARFHDRIEIRRDGALLYLDSLRLDGDVAAQMDRPALGAGAGAMATLIFAAPEAEAHLAPQRAMLPATAGASLVRDGVLAVRALAPDSFALRQVLIPILARLSGATLPRPWMI